MKKEILFYLEATGDPSLIDFKLHDFGYRGSTSDESAAIGGAAHLINFKGTDTLAAIPFINDYYYASEMPGFSIPAAEHSTITSWGKEHEVDAFENMLDQYPTGLVAVVSDSYDIYNACNELWGDKLRDKVLNRDGVLVVRPDSGDPEEVVVNVLDALGDKFGYTTNEKGFKVLDPHVRVIQGDGIDRNSITDIMEEVMNAGWSMDNLAFGSGGGLLQKVDRDTCKFAFKCSAAKVNGEWRDVYKDPITDPGKTSKKGRMGLVRYSADKALGEKEWHTVPYERVNPKPGQVGEIDQLKTVFENGLITEGTTFEEVRERAKL
jgi:nicotinamide phosphoribosyltransferase